MEMERSQSTLKIRDLGLAAALVSLDVKISDTIKDDKGRTYFIFCYDDDDAANIDTAIDNYWYNHLEVDARQYFDAIKMLKSLIYSER
jgi:hypothetical protein